MVYHACGTYHTAAARHESLPAQPTFRESCPHVFVVRSGVQIEFEATPIIIINCASFGPQLIDWYIDAFGLLLQLLLLPRCW